jgi:hypothetical protein
VRRSGKKGQQSATPKQPLQSTKSHQRLALVVKDRSDLQHLALDLLTLLDRDRPIRAAKKGARNPYDLLVGVTFSLWRAVFLVEATNDWEAALANAETFLEKMIRDNAIGYADDWNNRKWSFGFYVDNARYRLNEFAELVPEFKASAAFDRLSKEDSFKSPFWYWRGLCEALRETISILQERK